MNLSSINKEQRLYVMRSGAGYSCYGFDVLDGKARGALAWLVAEGRAAEMLLGARGVDVQGLAVPERVGTKKHFAACDKVLSAAGVYAVVSGSRCSAELTPELVGLEGRRVEVIDRTGERRRFIVGRSMGWMPVHLEIAQRRSTGGCAAMGAPYQSIRVLD